ncbi:MAG: hypothetical protein JSU72_06550 [Deltaproteobacteria bacterium]|nr:MAG: hypothetical protein JSU72_06550 [Deltaproteobacteria bacterium]
MQIRVDCPQCGGLITFDEKLEMVRCTYCGSTNQITGKSGLLRFMFTPRWTKGECRQRLMSLLRGKKASSLKEKRTRLVYAPYWRIKGMVFHWVLGKRQSPSNNVWTRSWYDAKELKTKAFDFSFPAYTRPDFGLNTLGVRAAALPLQIFHQNRLGGEELVLPTQVSPEEAARHSSGFLTFGLSDRNLKPDFVDTQLVGETYAVIYFPFWLVEVGTGKRTGLLIIDGVANRIKRTLWDQSISSFIDKDNHTARATDFGTLHLIPCRCPVCGWDLPFAPESKFHVCPTCCRAWGENNGNYKEIEYQLAAVQRECEHSICYMPFWDLETQIHTPEGVLRSKTDLCRLVPSLQVQGNQGGTNPETIHFLIPAFRIKSMPAFCKLATQFTVRPPHCRLRSKQELEKQKFAGVFLPGKEAGEMARVILISMVPKYHRRARQLLKNTKLEFTPPRLIYYPFFQKGLFLREANSTHSIQHGTVGLGFME